MSYFHDEDEVTVCDTHDTDVQLIWTFSFPYKEFWCPACGATYGMMGAGRDAIWNWRIHNQYIKDLKNLPKEFIEELRYFYSNYKKSEGKVTSVTGFEGVAVARKYINEAIELYKKKFGRKK